MEPFSNLAEAYALSKQVPVKIAPPVNLATGALLGIENIIPMPVVVAPADVCP